jgi:hypothetical protein
MKERSAPCARASQDNFDEIKARKELNDILEK